MEVRRLTFRNHLFVPEGQRSGNQLLLSSYKIMPGLTTMVPVGETMAADASRVVTNSPLSQPLSASCNPLLPPPASLSYLIESLLNGLRRTSHRLVK